MRVLLPIAGLVVSALGAAILPREDLATSPVKVGRPDDPDEVTTYDCKKSRYECNAAVCCQC
jgi:hypothetical protein